MVARSATLATLAQAQLSPTSSSFPITIPTIPDDVSKTMPPPPVPAPVRTHSSSTASSLSQPSRVSSQTTLPSTVSSTARSSLSPKLAPALVLPLVPPGSPLRKASNERMSFASGSATGVCGGVVAAKPPAKTDDLDRLGYVYSLRVAALQHRLKSSVSTSPKITLGPAAVISPLLPSPHTIHDSSSSAKSPAFGSFRTPDPVDQPLPMRRKKSALSPRLGRKDELKLPREFLQEFWTILTHEQGDMGWTQAVLTFLGMLQKKGTKTSTGANMRDIQVLYTTFSSCLPPAGMGSGPIDAHKSHFLTLLYNAMPKCTYFSSSFSEKDRDLLFRLRAEVQTLLHGPGSPVTTTSAKALQFSPELSAQGIAAKAGLGFIPPSPASLASSGNPITPTTPLPPATPPRRANRPDRPASDAGSVRRKPIPRWTGNGEGLDNMVEAVGAIWDVSQDTLEKDAEELDRYVLEKLYLDDLKRNLTNLSRQYQADPSHRTRHTELSRDLGDLLASFPELSIPTSPAAFGQSTQDTFFTPPRSAAVFARLSRKAEASSSRRALELVDRCRKIWGVESRVEKEREVETLVRQWDAAVGTDTEWSIGKRLADAAGNLASSLDPDEDVPRALEDLHVSLMEHYSKALNDIFPVTGTLPPPPPPSVLPLFAAAPGVLITSPRAAEILDNLADDLRGAAVGEYVTAAGDIMGGAHMLETRDRSGSGGKDTVVEGFERFAEWIEMEVANVEKVWSPNGPLNPAGLVISKQLPLFLAELQVLETAGGGASDVFVLYEVMARLLSTWERLCPSAGRDFDIDAFFEPHVLTWLRETEATETHQWVARTVGMDQWLPEGEGRHSQSVVDLFEFVRNATQVVRDLPVGEYKRAVYMVDLARTASTALELYAGTVSSLFMAEMSRARTSGKETQLPSGKAGAWLAKGKHAYGKLDAKIDQHRRRERSGFMVPPEAYVKLTNMGAASEFIDDLSYALEADESARVLREHNFSGMNNVAPRQIFSVQVVRGQNILTRGSAKPADSFVTIVDHDTGERLFKSRTVLETEDPKWEQSFEVSVGAPKTLDVVVYDRQLVGKHDAVGSRILKIDPAQFDTEPEHEVVLPLSPRGIITFRISAEGRERHDVGYHLLASKRVLERTASDMQLEIIDRLSEHLRSILCPGTLAEVVKPLRDRKRGRVALSDAEIDASLAPVLQYLDDNLSTINSTCAPRMVERLVLGLWERTVDILLALLIPPLSDRPSSRPALSPPEVDVVFKWLQVLKSFFNAADGSIPLSALQSGAYRDMLMLGQVLDLPTPALRERTAAAVRAASASGSRGVMGLRNLSLSPQDKATERARIDQDNERVAEVLLRVLRMRSLDDDFLAAQLAALTRAKVERGRAAGVV